MKLVIGLGNPGSKYNQTWHNVGFMVIDEFRGQALENFLPFKLEKKFKAEISFGERLEEKIILAKPQTYMNNSGQAVRLLANFYKIEPADIWIIHDDIDLPLSTIRISHHSSSGGHKGVQSIISELGTNEMVRFRVGIASMNSTQVPTEDFVLQKPASDQTTALKEMVSYAQQAIELALMSGLNEAMNEYN